MCGRYTLSRSAAEIQWILSGAIERHFGLASAAVDERAWGGPRYNVAPSQPVPVVRHSRRAGARLLEVRRWGLVPHWASDPSPGRRLVNARLESAATRPAFRDALRRRRCLLPADGFYEWRGAGRRREPCHVTLPGRALFGMAGLYEHWESEDGEVRLDSCIVLTTESRDEVARLHARMPVLVSRRHYAAWLDPELREPAALKELLTPTPADALRFRPVDARVNDVRFDGPECLETPLPPLFPEALPADPPEGR